MGRKGELDFFSVEEGLAGGEVLLELLFLNHELAVEGAVRVVAHLFCNVLSYFGLYTMLGDFICYMGFGGRRE
jgi:hypothetical protein